MDTIHTLQVSDTIRVTVQYDGHDTECPLEWSGAGYVSIRHPRLGGSFEVDPAGTADEVRAIVDQLNWHARQGDTEGAIETALVKHYARRGFVAKRLDLRGSSQSSWLDGFLYVKQEEAEWIDAVADSLQSWFAGEVYVVTLEQLEVWSSLTQPGETMTTWEYVSSVGGCYLDNFDDDLVSVARDLEGYPEDVPA